MRAKVGETGNGGRNLPEKRNIEFQAQKCHRKSN